MEKHNLKTTEEYSVDRLPGATIDVADGEKVNVDKVKADIKELNNNPENQGDPI